MLLFGSRRVNAEPGRPARNLHAPYNRIRIFRRRKAFEGDRSDAWRRTRWLRFQASRKPRLQRLRLAILAGREIDAARPRACQALVGRAGVGSESGIAIRSQPVDVDHLIQRHSEDQAGPEKPSLFRLHRLVVVSHDILQLTDVHGEASSDTTIIPTLPSRPRRFG